MLSFLLLIGCVIGLAYVRAPARIWTTAIAVILLVVTFWGTFGFLSLFLLWILFIAAAVFTNAPQIRQKYFTAAFISILAKRMPPISATEREAIEAGNVWWEKDLFCGNPNWQKFLETPSPQLTPEEQFFIDNQVETLCAMLNDWEIVNDKRDLPESVWNYLKQERFFGMVIPKDYDGLGFSALAHSTIVLKIATRSVSAAVNTMVPNSLGPAELLLHYGTDEQKNYYLPRLATGQEIPCFALTGPEAGSDAGSITDIGIVCRKNVDGQDILGINLSWDKRYITLAPVASVLGIAFKMYDPEHLLGDKENIGITLCLVPTSHPGVKIGDRHLPLHLAFMNGPTRGEHVFVPLDWIIGGAGMAGQGWRMLMECLSIGRAISLPALSTACGKLAYRTTGAYSRIRRQFNTPLAQFEGIEEALSEIGGLTYTLEACRILTAGAVDQNVKPSTASAIAKYHMTEIARKIIDHAMDIHAGHGIQAGPRNVLAHNYLATPISITVEGANILTRNLIIFGQGAIRCHPYILAEIQLFSQPESDAKLQQLDTLLLSHIGYFISNLAKNFCSGLTGGRFLHAPVAGETAHYYRQITRMSLALALLSDTCMLILGGALKRKERISARLGDMLSQLYLASSVLKYYQENGASRSDLSHVKWSVEYALNEVQKACDELLDNFPMRVIGKLLRAIIFPWGRAFTKPQDSLSQTVVKTMVSPSEFRDRLTRNCYVGKNSTDPIFRLDSALESLVTIEPILKKFQAGVKSGVIPKTGDTKTRAQIAFQHKLLTEAEVAALVAFETLQKDIIQVNEFSFDLKTVVT